MACRYIYTATHRTSAWVCGHGGMEQNRTAAGPVSQCPQYRISSVSREINVVITGAGARHLDLALA